MSRFLLLSSMIYFFTSFVTSQSSPCQAPSIIIKNMKDYENADIHQCTILGGNLTILLGVDSQLEAYKNSIYPAFGFLTEVKGSVHIIDTLTGPDDLAKMAAYGRKYSDEHPDHNGYVTRFVGFGVLEKIGGLLELRDLGSINSNRYTTEVRLYRLRNVEGGVIVHGQGPTGVNYYGLGFGADYDGFAEFDTPKFTFTDTTLSPGMSYPNSVDEMELYANGLKNKPVPNEFALVNYTTTEFRVNTRQVRKTLRIDGFVPARENIPSLDEYVYVEGELINESFGWVNITLETLDEAYVDVELLFLEWIPDLHITRPTRVEAALLHTVNNTLRLDESRAGGILLPNLTNVGNLNGLLSVRNCPFLVSLQMPKLETIYGDFDISNNSALNSIDGFPRLKSVEGNLNITGPISSVRFLELQSVDGSFVLDSTTNLDCSAWNEKQRQTGFVKGDYTCNGAIEPTFIAAGQGGKGDIEAAERKRRTTTIAGASTGAAAALLFVGLGAFYYIRRFRSTPKLDPGIAYPELEAHEAPRYEFDGKEPERKVEAPGIDITNEAPGEFIGYEMHVSDMIPVEIDGTEIERPPTAAQATGGQDASGQVQQQHTRITDEGRRRLYTHVVMISRGRSPQRLEGNSQSQVP